VTALTITDLLRAGDMDGAMARIHAEVAVYDPTEPVDVEAIRLAFEERRAALRAVVPPAPFPARVVYFTVNSDGAR